MHAHDVQFIMMCLHNMFSIIQYYMWYEFEMNKTFLSICITKKCDFILAGFCGVPLIYCQSTFSIGFNVF